jgi:hypothetical protein
MAQRPQLHISAPTASPTQPLNLYDNWLTSPRDGRGKRYAAGALSMSKRSLADDPRDLHVRDRDAL